MMAAAGKPIRNRRAVSCLNSMVGVSLRPSTVPIPHRAAAPNASIAGTASSTDTSNGLLNVIIHAPATAGTKKYQYRLSGRSPRSHQAATRTITGCSF